MGGGKGGLRPAASGAGTLSRLSTDELIDTARSRAGLEDFGGDPFRLALDRIVDGLEHGAGLTELGFAITPEILLSYLTNRLEIIDGHTRHPEIGRADVRPPPRRRRDAPAGVPRRQRPRQARRPPVRPRRHRPRRGPLLERSRRYREYFDVPTEPSR